MSELGFLVLSVFKDLNIRFEFGSNWWNRLGICIRELICHLDEVGLFVISRLCGLFDKLLIEMNWFRFSWHCCLISECSRFVLFCAWNPRYLHSLNIVLTIAWILFSWNFSGCWCFQCYLEVVRVLWLANFAVFGTNCVSWKGDEENLKLTVKKNKWRAGGVVVVDIAYGYCLCL